MEKKRAKDKAIQKIEAKRQAEKYRQRVEQEAYFLWEADGKPEGKDGYYWTLAIDKLKDKNVPTIYKPYYLLEKRILEPADAWIKRQASISILSQLAILAAIIAFIGGEEVRRNNEVFSAWQTITSAHKQSGSGGRREALQFLNSRPLRFPWIGWTKKRYFWDEREKRCKLKRLYGLRWKRQHLIGLSAPNAYLADIHLCGAWLWTSELNGAKLWRANLAFAILWRSNLQDAELVGANLERADVRFADFKRANFQGTILKRAPIAKADFRGAKNLTPKQVKSACHWKTAHFDPEFEELLKKEPDQEVNCR